MLRPVRVTPPADMPLAAADLIAQTPALADANADAVTAMIGAATAYLDGWSGILGRCLAPQTWRQDFCRFERCMRLPFPEARTPSVSYQDGDDEKQTVDASQFDLLIDAIGPYVRFRKTFVAALVYDDRPDAVSISFEAGYESVEAIPAPIKQAITLLVVSMAAQMEANGGLRSLETVGVAVEQYNSPQMMNQVSTGLVDMLLAPYRVMSV